MTRSQRLAVLLVAAAALLLLGRGFAILYVDRAWYTALGASSVWRSKVWSTTLLYTWTFSAGTGFIFLNLMMVRRSVLSLVLPARIGNVEIGEEIPSSRLAVLAMGMSACAAAIGTLVAPSWTTLALWESAPWFNESDPYFGTDFGYYVSWLPLESALYVWSFVIFAIAVSLVVTLYALTPSLRWEHGKIHVTSYARRHITILGVLLVLFTAWGFRLETYNVLITGNGPGGMFTQVDHQWLVPADLILSLVMVGASVVLLAAGWIGQTHMALGAVTGVILCSMIAKLVVPWISRAEATSASSAKREIPYVTMQREYTVRAFPVEPTPPSTLFAADSAFLTAAPGLTGRGQTELPNLIYPGARGVVVDADTNRALHAPRVGGAVSRLMIAWAEQDPSVLKANLSPNAAFIRRRDLRDRVAAVTPIFAQSQTIGARSTSRGIVWIIDLYSTSDNYPFSATRALGTGHLKYRHHAATAYVSGSTGNLTIVRDSLLDPIAEAWFLHHSGSYLSSTIPSAMTAPWPVPRLPPTVPTGSPESVFRARIQIIYDHMRAALDSGNFRNFGDAFDSLGAAVHTR